MRYFKKELSINDRFSSTNIVHYTPFLESQLLNAIDVFNDEILWDDMWDMAEVENRIRSGWVFNVLSIGLDIVGWTWLDTDKWYIRNVYISKPFQRKGWGSKLVRVTTTDAYNLGQHLLYAEVDYWNTPSIKMFEKLGWEI